MIKILLEQMNQVLSDWRDQFDVAGAVDMAFTQNDQGALCFNGITMHEADTLILEASDYDAEGINFVFARGRSMFISIVWPEDEPPRLHSVSGKFAYVD